jgi:RNA polymerase sigma-70 factor (ECF subfamily)
MNGDVVGRARAGDKEAFRELVEQHSRQVFRVAYRILGDEPAAEDAVQETFLRAYRTLHRFDGRAQFGTWLYRIASNQALDQLRRRKVRGEARDAHGGSGPALLEPLPSGEPGPDRRARSREVGRAARRAMEALSPLERAAFSLRHFEGRSTAEISRALGTRDSASKQAVFRAVKKLRQALLPFLVNADEAAR